MSSLGRFAEPREGHTATAKRSGASSDLARKDYGEGCPTVMRPQRRATGTVRVGGYRDVFGGGRGTADGAVLNIAPVRLGACQPRSGRLNGNQCPQLIYVGSDVPAWRPVRIGPGQQDLAVAPGSCKEADVTGSTSELVGRRGPFGVSPSTGTTTGAPAESSRPFPRASGTSVFRTGTSPACGATGTHHRPGV